MSARSVPVSLFLSVSLYRSCELRASRKSCLEGEGLHLFRYPSPLRDRLGRLRQLSSVSAQCSTTSSRRSLRLVVCTFGQYNRFLFWLLLLLAAKLLQIGSTTVRTYSGRGQPS